MKEKTPSNDTIKGLVNTLTVVFLMLSITLGTKQLIKMHRESNSDRNRKKCSCKKKTNENE